jgi:hypothetical protein
VKARGCTGVLLRGAEPEAARRLVHSIVDMVGDFQGQLAIGCAAVHVDVDGRRVGVVSEERRFRASGELGRFPGIDHGEQCLVFRPALALTINSPSATSATLLSEVAVPSPRIKPTSANPKRLARPPAPPKPSPSPPPLKLVSIFSISTAVSEVAQDLAAAPRLDNAPSACAASLCDGPTGESDADIHQSIVRE